MQLRLRLPTQSALTHSKIYQVADTWRTSTMLQHIRPVNDDSVSPFPGRSHVLPLLPCLLLLSELLPSCLTSSPPERRGTLPPDPISSCENASDRLYKRIVLVVHWPCAHDSSILG